MPVGSTHIWVTGDASSVTNPPAGKVLIGADSIGGPYMKGPGTPGGTDGAITYFGVAVEMLQDMVGTMLTDSADVDFAYDDTGGTISLTIKPGADIYTQLGNHLSDATAAHAASAVSYDGSANLSAVDVEAALDELDTEKASTGSVSTVAGNLATHIGLGTDVHDASAISYAGSTNLSAANVEAALDELDTEKQPVDATLTGLAAVTMAANKLAYGNGPDTFALTDLTAYGRTLAALADATANTALLDLATTAAKGLMSAIDKARADNWFNSSVYNVMDNGISPANTDAQNLTAWNALMGIIEDNGTVWFPPGPIAYDFSSVCAIPSGKHLKIEGSSNRKSMIRTTSATANIFTCGDWYNEFEGLKFTSSVTRTGGAAILSGDNVGINVTNCDFDGMWDGILYTGGVNAGNLAVISRCNWTATTNRGLVIDGQNANTIVDSLLMDAPIGTYQAGFEINQCGSVIVSNCDFIRAVNNLKLNANVAPPGGIFSAYFVNCFFDTSPASSVKFMGSASNIQRIKFVNCWFAGSVTGCEFASTFSTLPTAIDFVNCDIFSNSSRGIYANGVQDFSVNSSRIAGNGVAGIETVASAAAVTKFNLQNNTIGPTAGIGGNGTGVLINAGTYGSVIITGNNVAGNNSNNNIINNAVVATTDLMQVINNAGHLIQGQNGSLAAPAVVPMTTETLVLATRLPAKSVAVGQVFSIRAVGVCSGANSNTWRVRVGAVGTVAGDTSIPFVGLAVLASTTNGRTWCDLDLVIRSIGAAGTVSVEGQVGASAVTGGAAQAAVTAPVVNMDNPWFIDITLATTVGTCAIQNAHCSAL